MAYFKFLNYSLGDEDSSVEQTVLPEDSEHVVSIAGSGARATALLVKHPRRMTCIDVAPEQLALTECRFASVRELNHRDFLSFMGYRPDTVSPECRRQIFENLTLPSATRECLGQIFEANEWAPIIYIGRFEQMLKTMSKMIRLIAGPRLAAIFSCDTLATQRAFRHSPRFPQRRWLMALLLLGNATVLNTLLYKGEFPKKNIPGSAYQNYRRMFDDLFDNVLCRESFFFQMLVLGELRFTENTFAEADERSFNEMKRCIARADIVFERGDVLEFMRKPRKVDFLSLSDVPSFLDEAAERRLLRVIRDGLAERGRVVFRGHMRVADPECDGYKDITPHCASAIKAEKTQLWTVRVLQKA